MYLEPDSAASVPCSCIAVGRFCHVHIDDLESLNNFTFGHRNLFDTYTRVVDCTVGLEADG